MENREVRLIDANALIQAFWDDIANGNQYAYSDTEELINNAPTIDPEPVVYGQWVFDGQDHFCDHCNRNALCDKMTGEEVLSSVCPNCGAKMDKED